MTTFARYELEGKLGEGAMGVVYRARDRNLGRVVALKMLSPEMGAEDELRLRFQREAEAVGRLNHPNIVSVYDMGEHQGRLYLAMELLEGEDLRTLIEKQAPLATSERVRVLGEIAAGVAYAHSRGVVHRDLKPANILLTSTGHVKILDFGLARLATMETITRRGVILGTPDYMSPEQAMGKPVDARSDIFSSGAVFYEFLTLQKPFKGKTLHSVLYQIISEDPDAVLTLNPEAPARLALLVHRMLRKDPSKRPSSMDEVERELKELALALRRSLGPAAPLPPEEQRTRFRDALQRSRGHLEAKRFGQARREARVALALEPESEEAAELHWRSDKGLRALSESRKPDAASSARIEKLLARASPGQPDEDARRALAELALIAPDEPRLQDVLRQRAGKA
ncbi:MAG TPA: serine/threonine-protein kinase [Vicinamibacteria bacterium]|nr:serine/threonine-protein kinase [Vicinamibacteria bacterium]